MTPRPRALLSMTPDLPERLFDPATRKKLSAVYDVDWTAPVCQDLSLLPSEALEPVQALVTGWGAGAIDADILARMPNLRSIHHAAGSVRALVTDACWDRGIRVTTAADVNAIPVAEYAAAMIVLAGKQIFRSQSLYRIRRAHVDREKEFPTAGNFGAIVGIVGASRIGRRVIKLLRPYDIDVLVYDPYLQPAQAAALRVTALGLKELFSRSAVVSLHAPLLPSTTGMVTRNLLTRLPDGATIINTARGGLIDHAALEGELLTGRISAVLDATDPDEPLHRDSPLYDMRNVVLTPHMAGAVGNELHRLGEHAVDQAVRQARGASLDGELTRETAEAMA